MWCGRRTAFVRQQINEEDAVFQDFSRMTPLPSNTGPVFTDPHGVFSEPKPEAAYPPPESEWPEDIDPPDYAQQAKDILQKRFGLGSGGEFRYTELDDLVDLIIKAAKQ